MRALALALALLPAVVQAQAERPEGARDLDPALSGTWEMDAHEPADLGNDAPNEVPWLRLEIDGNRIVQTDTLRIGPTGEVVGRRIEHECLAYDVDRSPDARPAAVAEMVGCPPTEEYPGHGGYGVPTVEGDTLTFSAPGPDGAAAFRPVLRRVRE